MLKGLQSSGTRNDLNELSSNDSLSGSIEGDGEFVNHLSGVLGGVVHSRHPRALFRASSFLQGIVEKGCKTVFHVGLYDVSVRESYTLILAALVTASWEKMGISVVV